MDVESFQSEVLKLTNLLYRFARSRIRHNEDAEDAVQETFMKLWMMRSRLDQYERLDFLALKILRNICIDRVRRKKFHLEDLTHVENYISTRPSQHQNMELQEHMDKLEIEFQKLPEQQQTIFLLRNVEGYTITAIAEMLDLKNNTVEVNLSRARKKLWINIKTNIDG